MSKDVRIVGDKLYAYHKEYTNVPGTTAYVTRDGEVVNKHGNIMSEKGNRQYTIGRNKSMNIFRIVGAAFYSDKNKETLIIVKDEKDPYNVSKAKYYSPEEYCKLNNCDYDVICDNKYIIFSNGQCYSNHHMKFMSKVLRPMLHYKLNGKACSILSLLINSFGTVDMRNHISMYGLRGGIGIENVVPKADAELPDGDILKEMPVTKFKCRKCKCLFKAKSAKQILSSKKLCVPCSNLEQDKQPKLKFKKMENFHVCKRCGACYKEKVDSCLKCECLEFM